VRDSSSGIPNEREQLRAFNGIAPETITDRTGGFVLDMDDYGPQDSSRDIMLGLARWPSYLLSWFRGQRRPRPAIENGKYVPMDRLDRQFVTPTIVSLKRLFSYLLFAASLGAWLGFLIYIFAGWFLGSYLTFLLNAVMWMALFSGVVIPKYKYADGDFVIEYKYVQTPEVDEDEGPDDIRSPADRDVTVKDLPDFRTYNVKRVSVQDMRSLIAKYASTWLPFGGLGEILNARANMRLVESEVQEVVSWRLVSRLIVALSCSGGNTFQDLITKGYNECKRFSPLKLVDGLQGVDDVRTNSVYFACHYIWSRLARNGIDLKDGKPHFQF
jgi:hypothetical protein